MKNVVIAGLALSLSGSVVFAQGDAGGYDPKAKTILDEVSKTAKAYTSITATFTMTMEKVDKSKDVHEGEVVIKGKKYKITLNRKIKNKVWKEIYINNSTTTWNYSEKECEITIDNAPDPAKAKNNFAPTDIFTIHEKGFKYKFVKEEVQGGKTVQLIDLFPEQADKKNYHTVKVVIDKAKKQIISATFLNKDGSKTIYAVKTFTPNLEVADATFNMEPAKQFPKCEVVDLRE